MWTNNKVVMFLLFAMLLALTADSNAAEGINRTAHDGITGNIAQNGITVK